MANSQHVKLNINHSIASFNTGKQNTRAVKSVSNKNMAQIRWRARSRQSIGRRDPVKIF